MSNEVDYQQHGQVKPGKYMYDGYGLLGGQQQWPYGSYGGGYGNGAGGAYLPPSYIPPLPPQPQPAGPTPVPALPPPIGHPPVGDGTCCLLWAVLGPTGVSMEPMSVVPFA